MGMVVLLRINAPGKSPSPDSPKTGLRGVGLSKVFEPLERNSERRTWSSSAVWRSPKSSIRPKRAKNPLALYRGSGRERFMDCFELFLRKYASSGVAG